MISSELYFFDCYGLYHKKNVFSKTQIKEANDFFDNSTIKTQKSVKYFNVFEHNLVYLDMITHEEIFNLCNMCFGEDYRLDHAFLLQQDNSSDISHDNFLHGKNFGKNMSHYYLSSGQEHIESACWTRVGQLSVGVVLKGQSESTGGFCYIPGSHKSSYHISGQNVKELFLHNDGLFKQIIIPRLSPGDLVIFPECLVHGQSKMPTTHVRRMVYGMYFQIGIKFQDFSKEYETLRNITSKPEHLKVLVEPPYNLKETSGSKKDIAPYHKKRHKFL